MILDPYTKEKFWLVHGVIETHPLEEGIQQVSKLNLSSMITHINMI